MSNQTIKLRCPACQQKLQLSRIPRPGKSLTCPTCQQKFIPQTQTDTPPVAEVVAEPAQPMPAAGPSKMVLGIVSGAVASLILMGITAAAVYYSRTPASAATSEVAATQPKTNSAIDPQYVSHTPKPPTLTPATGKAQSTDATATPTNSVPTNSATANNPVATSGGQPDGTTVTSVGDDSNRPKPGGLEGLSINKPKPLGSQPDDPNRPKTKQGLLNKPKPAPFGGLNGLAAAPVAQAPTVLRVPVPVIIRVPVKNNTKTNNTAAAATPKISVSIRSSVPAGELMKVDHQSNPGVSAKLSISLTGTPKSPVTIRFACDQGLTTDRTSITFAGNVVPTTQTITISGNGQANLTSTPFKVANVTVTASGGGLQAGGPSQIPVQIMRRTRWTAATGGTITRADVTGGTNKFNWLQGGTVAVSGATGVYYTNEFVQVTQVGGPLAGLRYRLYADRVQVETTPGSGNFSQRVNGGWQ